jgi:hypothetical protein
MPPRRKAAAVAAPASQRTLRSFATASKTTAATAKGLKRKLEEEERQVEDAQQRPVIVQDGDEDVVVPAKRIKTTTTTTTTATTTKATTKEETKVVETTDARSVIVQNGDEDIVIPAKRARATTTTTKKATTTKKKAPANSKASGTLDGFLVSTPKREKDGDPLDGFVKTPKAAALGAPSLTQRSGNVSSRKEEKEEKEKEEKVEKVEKEVEKVDEKEDERYEEQLPESLALLIPLHAALLTALLLHKAQNASGIFPSFAAMKPHMERLTGHRVSLDEIRRIVFLSHYNSAPSTAGLGLHLVDYGAGKMVIKFVEDDNSIKLVNSERLKRSFQRKAHEFWSHLHSEDVPLAQIAEHTHKATINKVLRGKSQLLLKELKATPTKSTAFTFTAKKPGTPAARTNSLLDRIRAKAAAAEKPLSPEELVRRAAEGRVREVTEILRSYRAKGESVGVRAAVENVRESVKNPIGVTEAEMAVRLVGEREEWCSVREVGGVSAVVFHRFEGDASFA